MIRFAFANTNQNLTRNSYSGSFKVMHLGIAEKPSKGCISCMYILYILPEVSEQSQLNRWKITIFDNPTVVWRPSPRNPNEYPHVPYIYRN